MRRTLCAIALISGFGFAAQAQTSLTLYGTADAGFGIKYLKNKDTGDRTTKKGMLGGVWDSSSWGLKGTEDLGGGLKVSFELEQDVYIAGDQSSSGDFSTSKLALISDTWGSLSMGRIGNAVQNYAGWIAGPDDDDGISDISNTFSAAGSDKVDNTILYTSPIYKGWNFAVGYSRDARGTSDWIGGSDQRLITSAVNYSNGPVEIVAGYDRLKAGAWQKPVHSWILAGSYQYASVTFGAAVGQDINGRQSSLGTYFAPSPPFASWDGGYTENFKTTGLTASATVAINESSTAYVGWSGLRASQNFRHTHDLRRSYQNIFSAGYTYSLSKRSMLYAIWAYTTGFAFQNVHGQQFIVGLNHKF